MSREFGLCYMQSTLCKMPSWMNPKLESRLPGEISITSYADDTTLMAEGKRGTKEPLDEGERGDWKAGLKLNIQKTKIMTSSPNTSWQIDGETMETGTEFIFWAPKSL